jgi:DNA-binding response OmpR family regulator
VVRVLIVDDDRKFVPLLERGFRYEGFDVTAAATGAAGLDLLHEAEPDVVILDIGMPGLDGFDTLRRIRTASDVPVVMLTARDEVADKVTALGAGADDYVPKPFSFDELLARVRAVLRRRDVAADPVLSFADLRVDLGTRAIVRDGRHIELTAREFDLLVYFLRHPRQVLTRDALRQAVWGFDCDFDTNVVDVNLSHLRKKLGEPRLLQTVRGVGYVLRT